MSDVEETNLLKLRKLVLLVDLDQTLIHSTDVPTNTDGIEVRVYNCPSIHPFLSNIQDIHHYRVPGTPFAYWTKIRPHTLTMLQHLSALFELHICTFGNRPYAHTVCFGSNPIVLIFGGL
jgi:RNA polymerase II subunit A-like phosphatase